MSDQALDIGMRELLDYVELGAEVEAFLKSPVGNYIQERCAIERANAVTKLLHINPSDVDAVRILQNEAWRAESLINWLIDAVQNGATASIELRGGYQPE